MDDLDELELALIEGLPDGVTVQGMILEDEDPTWRDIDTADTANCEHQETLCAFCLDSWLNDWDLRLVDIVTGHTLHL